jgi:hypothetical protein
MRQRARSSDAKIPFDDSRKKTTKESAKWLKATGLTPAAEAAAGFLGKRENTDAHQ